MLEFKDADSPSIASRYVLTPVFVKGEYAGYHSLPTGARAVPTNSDGKRRHDGYTFHYSNVVKTESPGLPFATHDDPFPKCREGCLDKDMLTKLGLTERRMREKDAFFFPMCVPHLRPTEVMH